jgi:hypothetical protein
MLPPITEEVDMDSNIDMLPWSERSETRVRRRGAAEAHPKMAAVMAMEIFIFYVGLFLYVQRWSNKQVFNKMSTYLGKMNLL